MLDSLRHQGDPAADDGPVTVALPPWANLDRTTHAANFFADNRLHIGMTLSLGSLITCYAIPRGARLLAASGGLDAPLQRVHATAAFVLAAVQPRPDVTAVAQVRHTHARVRRAVLHSGHWNTETDGVPLCQEDLLGALMLFSAYVLHLLPRLGVHPTERDTEDYLHLWCVVGSMLGLPDEVLPEDFAEATRLCELMQERHIAPSDEGKALTRTLIGSYQNMLPGVLGAAILPAVRHVLPPRVTECVGIAPARWAAPGFPARIRLRGLEHALFDWFLRELSPQDLAA
ncbi:DUF2236 domain-containing protein [Lentzea tibetensis]|uniref:DUF2236 domain-containing protein n=1 Tax=Lentzea tibetensis TaxID=2591470 RepID=A0A563ELG1_9PSEU|nr:oxygenase MpaB family protein [Lentzea tibetensis]TWP48035.1 DUF2236 domain-containing protein [Lentzea tibetensis]